MINSVGKRIAIFIVTVFIATFMTILSVDALRNNVFDFLVNIYEDFIAIFYNNSLEDNSDKKIEEIYVPQYLPEGFEIILNDNRKTVVLQIYSDAKDNRIIFEQIVYSIELIVDTENREYENIDINGNTGLFYIDRGINHLIWNDSKYNFQLKAPISKEEMIKIAESIIPQ